MSVPLSDAELAVVELAAVERGTLDSLSPPEREMLAGQLSDLQGQLSLLEYRSALRSNADVITR